MKIGAIFSDYDGTLAPCDAPLESSVMPGEIEEPLKRLSSMIPIAIVTSKDFHFIRPRTPFASAWACVSGLEIVLPDGRMLSTPRVNGRLLEGLGYVRRHDEFGLALELKYDTDGELLAFSIDWRRTAAPPREFIESTTTELARMGLTSVHDPSWTFIDVFGARPDKGRAVKELRRLLNVTGNVLFIGDSTPDNAAFEESDVAMCVDHGQGISNLNCGFVLRYDEVGPFLHTLAEHGVSVDVRALRRKSPSRHALRDS